MLRPRTPLFNTATDSGNAGGGTPSPVPTPPAAPGAPTPQTAAQPPPSTAKAGVIDSAIAMFRDKGSLAGEITTLKATNGKLTADLAATHAQLATVTAERDNLQAGFSRLEAALAEAAKEKTTLQTEVTHQLASAGVPETALPKPVTTASSAETVEELRKQLESPTLTAQQRGDLVARIRKINAAN